MTMPQQLWQARSKSLTVAGIPFGLFPTCIPASLTTNVPNPDAYNGAYITAMTSAFPDDAVITFNLTPLGPLADGRKGRPLSITRTGAALKKGGGPINGTSFLHDIPLGRYRVAAEVRYANGKREGTTLELRDGGNTSGSTLDITFTQTYSAVESAQLDSV